ncbi:hypothetical protein LMG28138_05672 [Pararobbsia alpina]|uniref:Uncharacterized protein n=1 Tax=Pararobbsia alpina TaxID=621374 RepID=A0A6S7C0N8_9BURK|nr:hypothetical protein LMG28138_05672 [Pararobbsia alpina]
MVGSFSSVKWIAVSTLTSFDLGDFLATGPV